MTRVVFMGTPAFALPSLCALYKAGYDIAAVVTQPDKPRGRHMKMTPPPVKEAAAELELRILQPDSVRSDEFADAIQDLNPELIVTAAYGKILPRRILEIPRACINVHASLLPKYRGASPIQACLFNGDEISGVTIMLMDEGMDTGDILTQSSVAVPLDMNAGELTERLAELGADLLTETLPGFISGEIIPLKQNESEATVVRPVTRSDGCIDWTLDVRSVHDKVRGCYPWPGAFSSLNGKRIKIFRTSVPVNIYSPCDICYSDQIQGTIVVSPDKGRIFIKCSDGFIEIHDLQIEGCRNLPASVCAHNFAYGAVLGGN